MQRGGVSIVRNRSFMRWAESDASITSRVPISDQDMTCQTRRRTPTQSPNNSKSDAPSPYTRLPPDQRELGTDTCLNGLHQRTQPDPSLLIYTLAHIPEDNAWRAEQTGFLGGSRS
jgi:hypothetical protein